VSRQGIEIGLAAGIALQVATWAGDSFVTVPQLDSVRSLRAPPSADVSADGRFIAFESYARLAPSDEDDRRDIYVLNRATGYVTLEADRPAGWWNATHPRISGDGRHVVFEADARTEDPLPYRTDIILRDRSTGSSRVLGSSQDGRVLNGSSHSPVISDDGRVVVFSSNATNLVPGEDANGPREDVYIWEVDSSVVRRISVESSGAQSADGASFAPSVSADGRWIAFVSSAPLDPAARRRPRAVPPLNLRQVYVHDAVKGTTTQVSVGNGQSWPDSACVTPAISGDGRSVAFVSDATNLVRGDRNRAADVFLHDRETGTTMLVSRAADGGSANGISTAPSLSYDGRVVAFQSDASNLVCAGRCSPHGKDLNLLWDVFVAKPYDHVIFRASDDHLGGWMEPSISPALDSSGLVVAFSSRHPREASDRANDFDLFLRAVPELSSTEGRRRLPFP